jgi:murein DD-endopeptidase MepM/ murein hydrolase activator NlpD
MTWKTRRPERSTFAPLRTSGVRFHPPIRLPAGYAVCDFVKGTDPEGFLVDGYGVGRYDERRPGLYAGRQFTSGGRDIHMGIDLVAPAEEPVHAFFSGTVFKLGDNARPYDYGPTLITRHEWLGQVVYAVHGHLSRRSLVRWSEGDPFAQGAVLGWLGTQGENGGWHPHLHFQLSLVEPDTHDLPGVVSEADRDWARTAFPDPRKVLGPLY